MTRGSTHVELIEDFCDDGGSRGGGQRKHGRVAELFAGSAEAEKGRAEVVAPLRNGVRLVDDEEGDTAGSEFVEELAILQLLWRDVDEAAAALGDVSVGGAALARR